MTALLVVLGVVAGCGSSEDDAPDAAPEPIFSIAVIADTHVTGNADNEARLSAVIDAINAEAAARKIELVLVLGDIGWNDHVSTAKGLLDGLVVPYVPLIGDNEIHAGDEHAYDTAFASQYAMLESTLDNWQRQPVPVLEPVSDDYAWLENFSFDYRGLHIIAADWCARGIGDLAGEMGYLHDFEGGTWPWFEAEVAASANGIRNRIVIASHIPMHNGTFERETMQPIETLIGAHAEFVYANLAGHTHLNYDYDVAGLYTVYVTAATWNAQDPLRVLGVATSGDAFVYSQELLYVPF